LTSPKETDIIHQNLISWCGTGRSAQVQVDGGWSLQGCGGQSKQVDGGRSMQAGGGRGRIWRASFSGQRSPWWPDLAS
jgi:hypothetical protein